jgi:type I restriction enzyme, S subunit
MSWPTVPLGEITEKIGSGSTPRGGEESYKSSGVPLVRSMNVHDGEFFYDGLAFLDDQQAEALRHVTLQAGDVLLNITGASVARVCKLPEQLSGGRVNQHVSIVRPDPRRLDPGFLAHLLRAPEAKARLLRVAGAGATREAITKSQIEEFGIPLPALDEQRRIAAILDKVDALRRKRKRALALLDGLTQSIFLEMFGDLVENSVYQRGSISHWVSDFGSGKNLAPDPDGRQAGGYRVLKVSAVTTGTFLPAETKPLPAAHKPPAMHMVRKGDLLFSRANTAELIGATAYVESAYEKVVLPDKIWRFIWRSGNVPHPRFIKALFSTTSFRREISKRATGTSGSMKNISKDKVLGIKVGLPDRSLQDAFVVRLGVTQRASVAASSQSLMLVAQFSSLQHLAFSGRL